MRFHYLLFLAAFWHLLLLLGATPYTLPQHSALHARVNKKAGSSKTAGKNPASQAEGRQAYVIFKIKPEFENKWLDPNAWPAHSTLWIDGNAENGAVKIDLSSAGNDYQQPEVWLLDFQKDSSKSLSWKAIFCGDGAGVIMDAVNEDSRYRTGNAHGADLNTCHDVLKRLVDRLPGLRLTPNTDHWMNYYCHWVRGTDGVWNRDSSIQRVVKYVTEDSETDIRKIKPGFKTIACRDRKRKRDGAGSAFGEDYVTAKLGCLEGTTSDRGSAIPDGKFLIAMTEASIGVTSPPDVPKHPKNTLAKLSGTLMSYLKPAVKALGCVSAGIGAAFLIIDLFNRRWKNAAVYGIGLTAGIAASLVMCGPIEWVIGGPLTILFAKKSPAFCLCLTFIVDGTALNKLHALHLSVVIQSVLTSLPHWLHWRRQSNP